MGQGGRRRADVFMCRTSFRQLWHPLILSVSRMWLALAICRHSAQPRLRTGRNRALSGCLMCGPRAPTLRTRHSEGPVTSPAAQIERPARPLPISGTVEAMLSSTLLNRGRSDGTDLAVVPPSRVPGDSSVSVHGTGHRRVEVRGALRLPTLINGFHFPWRCLTP